MKSSQVLLIGGSGDGLAADVDVGLWRAFLDIARFTRPATGSFRLLLRCGLLFFDQQRVRILRVELQDDVASFICRDTICRRGRVRGGDVPPDDAVWRAVRAGLC